MRKVRTINTQSRPAAAVAQVSRSPVVRSKASNGSPRLKLVPKTKAKKSNGKAKEIHFKGYQYLVDNSMEFTANAINALFDPDPEDYPADLRLRKNAVNDFMVFIKTKYFQKEGLFCISDDGDLSVDWYVDNDVLVNINFCGKKEITIRVSGENGFAKYIKLNSLLKVLKKHKVPTV